MYCIMNKHFFALCLLFVFTILSLIVFNQLQSRESVNPKRRSTLNSSQIRYFASPCKCRNHLVRTNHRVGDVRVDVSLVNSVGEDDDEGRANATFLYSFDTNGSHAPTFSCSMYNSLRRGAKSKILAYSLYGRNERYYKILKKLVRQADALYPEWLIRVYHDRSIRGYTRCQIECLKRRNGAYYNNVDFCDIEELPASVPLALTHSDTHMQQQQQQTWNASYMHAMMWRWLPIGDSFVDVFSSRDMDSPLLKREVDSVKVWMRGNTLFHVMRDHPQHRMPMLGGLWGFKTQLNGQMSSHLYSLVVDKANALALNSNASNEKNRDQDFLSTHVYPLAARNATIHDSYSCWRFNDSTPWPTRRAGLCYVGCNQCDCTSLKTDSLERFMYKCPRRCRPNKHWDWYQC